jgi:hypothetical protein
VRRSARGFPDVEPDDALDVGFRLQAAQQALPEEACDTGDRDGSRSHESP